MIIILFLVHLIAKSGQTGHPISVFIDHANVKIGNNSIPPEIQFLQYGHLYLD